MKCVHEAAIMFSSPDLHFTGLKVQISLLVAAGSHHCVVNCDNSFLLAQYFMLFVTDHSNFT